MLFLWPFHPCLIQRKRLLIVRVHIYAEVQGGNEVRELCGRNFRLRAGGWSNLGVSLLRGRENQEGGKFRGSVLGLICQLKPYAQLRREICVTMSKTFCQTPFANSSK